MSSYSILTGMNPLSGIMYLVCYDELIVTHLHPIMILEFDPMNCWPSGSCNKEGKGNCPLYRKYPVRFRTGYVHAPVHLY
jgi:hypothetical protein